MDPKVLFICHPDEKKEIEQLLEELVEIANILAASILTMKGKR